MAEYPTGYEVYHALVRLLEVNGVADAAAAVDVTLVPEGKRASYTVVPTERARPVLAAALGGILHRPFRTDEASWVLEATDTDPVLAASNSWTSVLSGPRDVRRLRRSALPADTVALARYLIGKTLVHDMQAGRTSGRIVETEAYVVGDAAGHAFRGETRRNRSLFLRRGHAYVYFIYGVSYLLNVSGEQAGIGAGVLLRALEPLEGMQIMRERRGTVSELDLARGPGRLTVAMGVDIDDDGVDLCGRGPLWLGTEARAPGEIGVSVRIGITKEADRLLRFFEVGSRFVSGPLRLNSYVPEQNSMTNPTANAETQRTQRAAEKNKR